MDVQHVESIGSVGGNAPVLPLRDRRVLVTRAEDQAADFVQRLHRLGAEPVLCPTIETVAPDDFHALDLALAALGSFDWVVFTSANGVRFTFGRMRTLLIPSASLAKLRIAAVGPATANVLREYGIGVDFVPQRHVAEGLIEEIGNIAGAQVLLPLADIARPIVADGLRARGAIVTAVTAYRTVPVAPTTFALWLASVPPFDIATFTSSSTVRNFVELAGEEQAQTVLNRCMVACIGPITAQTAHDYGINVDIVAEEHTTEGLLRSLLTYLQPDKDVL